jgi:hypothetical protein
MAELGKAQFLQNQIVAFQDSRRINEMWPSSRPNRPSF